MSRTEGGEASTRNNLFPATEALELHMNQRLGKTGHPGRQSFAAAMKGCENVEAEVLPRVRGPYPKKPCR